MSRLLIAFAALALLPSISPAQLPCQFGDDGFGGPCCDDPHPNLPDFPEVSDTGVYACYRECDPSDRYEVRVDIGRPEFFLCDQAIIEMRVQPTTPGGPTISGRMIAKYSRTWISIGNGNVQVWRFLLNGDWDYGPVGALGCPAPPHANPTHVTGSIDYACNPNSPVPSTRFRLDLSHLPGCISHGAFSARPLGGATGHRDRSYHLVAPANFNFGSVNDIQGDFRDDAVRSSPTGSCFPQTYRCLNESEIREGTLRSDFKNCLCVNLNGGPWAHQTLRGEVVCNNATSTFESVANFDGVIPTGLAGLRLGSWIGPAWPGDVELTVYVGYLRYADVCGAAADLDPHRVCGVGTSGDPGYLLGPSPVFVVHENFIDLEDNLVPNTANPIPVPGPLPTPCVGLSRRFGAPAYSSLVWGINPQ